MRGWKGFGSGSLVSGKHPLGAADGKLEEAKNSRQSCAQEVIDAKIFYCAQAPRGEIFGILLEIPGVLPVLSSFYTK
jgi:hypothetical protein